MKRETGKILKLLILYCIWTSPVNSQSIDPFCENIASGTAINQDLTFDWNIGESLSLATMNLGARSIYSSGFLQNRNEVELTYKQLDSFNLKITIGPNPATSHILISCNQDGIIIQTIKIMDAFGITIKDIIEPAAGINYKKQIQLASLPNGIYLVLVKYTIAEKMVGFKLVKIIKI